MPTFSAQKAVIAMPAPGDESSGTGGASSVKGPLADSPDQHQPFPLIAPDFVINPNLGASIRSVVPFDNNSKRTGATSSISSGVETAELDLPSSPDQGAFILREIGNLGYDAANPEPIDREAARQVLIDLFFGMSNEKLLLIERPMQFALESSGAFFNSEKTPFVIISSARPNFLDFLLTSEHSKQTLSLHSAGEGINTSLRHNAAHFDRRDKNGMYFQYQALGDTWPCTVGIFPDAETTFTIFKKLGHDES